MLRAWFANYKKLTNMDKHSIILGMRTTILIVALMMGTTVMAQTYTLCDKWVDCGNSCQLLDPYYSEGVTFTWTGPSRNGKANGTGVAKKYKDGVLESTYEGEYKDGIREGHGKFTHADGSVKEGTFVNGQLMGEGKAWDDEGLTYEGSFINYRLHGKGKIKYGNGTTFEGFFVSDNPYTGKITRYDGTEIYIQAGERVEKIKEKKTNYSPKMGVMQTEYFDEDWNRCEPKDAAYYRHVTYKAPNTPDGIVKDYYISGKLQSTFTCIYMDYNEDGKNFKEGEALWYHENGQLNTKQYYYNNKINGPVKQYDEYGTLRSSENFIRGVRDGENKTYYSDGSINAYAIYDHGTLKDGKLLRYDDDGDMFFEYDIDFDEREDELSYSGQNGEVGVFSVEDNDYLFINATPGNLLSCGVIDMEVLSEAGMITMVSVRAHNDDNPILLVWGWKDWGNYNAFIINENSFKYACYVRGNDVTNCDWIECSYIDESENALSVWFVEDNVTFMINGNTVAEETGFVTLGDYCFASYLNTNESENEGVMISKILLLGVPSEQELMAYVGSYSPTDEWKSSGSGFFVSSDGYIATNNHVVEDAKAIEVTFQRNGVTESHEATLVQADRLNDLAILKISDDFSSMDPLPYNFSTAVKETGSEVFTLGYPLSDVMGSEVKFTDGKISSKTGIQGDVRMYQISVPVQPGNSGGPLFDSSGNLVGITSARLNKDYFDSENVNYAIKSLYLQSLVDVLPVHINLQQSARTSGQTLTEKIKSYKDYIVFIKVK